MSLHSFAPFSVMHAVIVLVFAIATAMVVRASRALDAAQRDRRRVRIGLVVLGVQVVYQCYWLIFRSGSGESLPLHLCDVAGAVTVAAFLLPIRPLRALLYYWGLGLSTLAFLIPVVESGPSSAEFWLFWISHWVIVGGALYLVLVDRFRPTWKDLGLAIVVMLAYGMLTVFLNHAWGSNYMYTGDHPMPTPGDLDIAWPTPRLLVFGAAAAALMLTVHLPWVRTTKAAS